MTRSVKKVRLNPVLSEETIRAMAAATMQAGGRWTLALSRFHADKMPDGPSTPECRPARVKPGMRRLQMHP